MFIKRLKKLLLGMELNTSTYHEMYNGSLKVIDPSKPWLPPEKRYDPTYYHEDIGFKIIGTHKLAQDIPTVMINIPLERLSINSFDISEYNVHIADYCLRDFAPYINSLNNELYNRSRPDNENGKYYLHNPGGEVMVRNTSFITLCPRRDYEFDTGCTGLLLPIEKQLPPQKCLCFMLQVQLPKRKLRKTIQMLCRDLPETIDLFIAQFDNKKMENIITLAKKQLVIRNWLKENNYCAFIANGSILPRSKGTTLPMENAVPFRSEPADEVELFGVKGMGIKRGVTVITGGGYSGKSTILDAISAGIYDHCFGDGRELCITDESAVTISAEDGRSVKNVNISPFIKWLPSGNTIDFSTDHASGSTSQAANIMEAVDSGARLLLIDEDRSATNFMIRDRMMKELIKKEPITPFTERVNELYTTIGVSTILVIGGSGEYLSVADKIYLMDDFLIYDVTEKSKLICSSHGLKSEILPFSDWSQKRILSSEKFSSYPEGKSSELLEVSDMGFILIGDEKIDLRGLHDLVTKQQLDSLGFMLRFLELSNTDQKIDIKRKIDDLYDRIESEGLDIIYSSYFTTCRRFLDLPRKQELLSVINRMRKINMEKIFL